MKPAEADVIKFPVKVKLVCSGCGAPGEGSCDCDKPYVRPRQRAADAIKANPDKSNRAIADELGIAPNTVRTARISGAQNCPPEKRTGRDGKSYRVPKSVAREERIAELMDAGLSTKEIAFKMHMHERTTAQAMEHVRIAREAEARVLNQLDVDPDTLSISAKAKLDAATRSMERKLQADYAARLREVDEEVRLRVVAEGKEYLDMVKDMEREANETITLYRERINEHKPLFTTNQFKTILMCLHPDGQRTAERLADAFRLFNGKKLQLTGEK